MKKHFHILASFSAAVYLLFMPFVVFIAQFVVHYRHTNMHFYDKEPTIIVTTLDKSEFEKLCSYDKKEIFIDNHLYDIICYKYLNAKVILKLYKDTKETNLLNTLKTWMKNQKKSQQGTSFFSVNAPIETGLRISPQQMILPHQKNPAQSFSVLCSIIEHPTPPPKL